MRETLKTKLYEWFLIVAGSIITALAFNLFFIPNHIAPGGLSGLATEMNALIPNITVGTWILLLNVPLFLGGWRVRGHIFMARTLVATLLLSLLIDYIRLPQWMYMMFQDDILLATVYGSLLMGAGVGITIRGNATTGGTDLAGVIINHYWPGINIAWAMFAVDALVVAGAAFIFEPKAALYALAAVFIGAKIADFILTGARSAKLFFVISHNSEIITKRILLSLDRGVTILNGRGAYSGAQKDVLFCIVAPPQIMAMKKLIAEEDPKAFVVVTDVKEVLGEGFMPHVK